MRGERGREGIFLIVRSGKDTRKVRIPVISDKPPRGEKN